MVIVTQCLSQCTSSVDRDVRLEMLCVGGGRWQSGEEWQKAGWKWKIMG